MLGTIRGFSFYKFDRRKECTFFIVSTFISPFLFYTGTINNFMHVQVGSILKKQKYRKKEPHYVIVALLALLQGQ